MDPTDDQTTATEQPAGSDTPTNPAADTPAEGSPAAAPADSPKSMLEAIDAGIAAAGGGMPELPADDEAAADEPPAPASQPKEAPKPAAGKEPAAAAKPAGKEPPPKEPAAAPKKEPKAAKEPAAPATPADPVNDPIPAEVKGRTRERMTALITNVKELSAECEQLRTDRNDILGMIEQTGATPDQYSQALDYLAAVNSRDPARIKQAIGVAQRELAALAAMIGEPVPGVDMLGQHADLQAEVEAGTLSRARAEEIAAARARSAVQVQEGQRHTQQQQHQRAVNEGRASLNRVEAELRASDPLYDQKKAMLVPVLKPVLDQLPPAQWERAFRAAYARLQLPASASVAHPHSNGARTTQPMRVNQQPLRAQQPAGSARREASSMLDAINEGIEQGSRVR